MLWVLLFRANRCKLLKVHAHKIAITLFTTAQPNRHLKGVIWHAPATQRRLVGVQIGLPCSRRLWVPPLSSSSPVDYLVYGTSLDHSSKKKIFVPSHTTKVLTPYSRVLAIPPLTLSHSPSRLLLLARLRPLEVWRIASTGVSIISVALSARSVMEGLVFFSFFCPT